ncbi:MAG TPA: mannose-1-phosphate guanylyltransferase/mannose-6-phosphate isomerase [Gammaproteobacteria bacterium]|nr:mannose-1-phosphate guanylyltransferase/mannose-6-phosphate isomerase [Gammaproteobacteria bacterium]
MSDLALTPVILCGGSGTRLWPLSRTAYPKQLLPLFDGKSLLQQTLLRLQHLPSANPPWLICNQAYRFIVAEQVRALGISDARIILEPEGKNTAPAVTLAALLLQNNPSPQLMLVLPADQVISEPLLFRAAIEQGTVLAQQNYLLTFGVKPTKPETAYGYIQKGKSLGKASFAVKQFREKPDRKTAENYLRSAAYFWNSGIFLFQVDTYLKEIELHAPDLKAACECCVQQIEMDLDFYRLPASLFSLCRNESLDYAIMEKSQKIAVVHLAAEWRDLGSWSALWELQKPLDSSNVIKGDVITEQVNNSYLHAESRLLAIVGLSDVVVVETADAVMVAHKDKCQEVKNLVDKLKAKQRSEVERHRREYRPWGYYELLNQDPDFHAKRLVVKPGAKLSLQSHQYRSEHWVVIRGRAQVTCGEKKFELKENQSTFIPAGVKHRLENATTTVLELLEVQTGSYFGEDDILRFEDLYQRTETLQKEGL